MGRPHVINAEWFDKIRCDGCKHWESDNHWFDGDYGQCKEIPVATCHGCDHIGTPADFGCVLFEAKEAKADDNGK